MNNILPDRIEPDAIIEALVEFRFEHAELPELVLGRLVDLPCWEGFEQVRLPTADIPQPIRDADPNLRYQPLIELRKADGSRTAKIGGHVLSYHVTGPYPGWATFKPEIEGTFQAAIKKFREPQFSRIGFRYINVFRPENHFIGGFADTNVVLKIGNEVITRSLNVNYMRHKESSHIVTVKLATADLVGGNLPAGYSLLCDIDVGTVPGSFITSFADGITWIERAHTLEKAEFFALLPQAITNRLQSKSGETHE